MISGNNSKPLGFYKNRSEQLKEYKENIRQIQKKNRFQAEKLTKTSVHKNLFQGIHKNQFALSTQSTLESLSSQTNQSNSKHEKARDEVTIELKSLLQGSLPPVWVDLYDECILNLKHIEDIYFQLQEKGRERVRKGFGDIKMIDQTINELAKESNSVILKCQTYFHLLKKLIRECERKISQIDQACDSQSKNSSEAQGTHYLQSQSDKYIPKTVRKNVKSSLAQQISEATIKLRKQQKTIYDQMKQQGVSISSSSTGIEDSYQSDNSQYQDQQKQIHQEILDNRDKDINRLVDQINELSDIYKTLGVLVIDQGTLLDRIDFNITTTKDNVIQANKHLVKAVAVSESKVASKIIQILIGFIVFFSFLLVLKYSA